MSATCRAKNWSVSRRDRKRTQKIVLAHVELQLTTLSTAGIHKPESDVVQIIIHQLSDYNNVETRSLLAVPGLTLVRVEEVIRSSDAPRKAGEFLKRTPSTPAAPSVPPNPLALVVGPGLYKGHGLGGGFPVIASYGGIFPGLAGVAERLNPSAV